MTKTRYPTKNDVIKALKHDEKSNKDLQKLTLIVEYHKISRKVGLVTAEVIQNNKEILRGKIACFPEKEPEGFDWTRLKIGESTFTGYSLDYKGDTIMSMLTEGFKKSIKGGKIPFIGK